MKRHPLAQQRARTARHWSSDTQTAAQNLCQTLADFVLFFLQI
jgi:hypothetical protein